MFFYIIVLIFATFADFSTKASKLPSNFGRCSLNDPNIDECLRKNVEDAIGKLINGSPELGLSSLEPLEIPELTIGEGTGPVNVVQHFVNVKLHGLTDTKLLSAAIDMDNNVLTATSLTPKLILEAHYDMKGKVLLVPIVGEGLCNITLENLHINHTLTAERVEKKGNVYWNLLDFKITLRPEKMIYKFDNLYGGDERLAENILNVLNDNWEEVFLDVRDGYEKSLGLVFNNVANRAFSRVPLKNIYLDFDTK